LLASSLLVVCWCGTRVSQGDTMKRGITAA
jgi:hypothetical protein